MSDRETLPINHSTGSHVVHTVGGAAGGGVKGGLWGLLIGGVASVGLGAAIFFGAGLLPLTGAVGGAAVMAGAIGGLAATLFSFVPFTTLAAGIGGAIGGFKGAEHGHQQVRQDRAAAHMVDSEVGAMQAQAAAMQAQAQMMAQSRGGVPSTVLASSIDHQGRAAAMQQQLAGSR